MVGDIISLGVFDSEDEWTQQKLRNSMVGFVRLPMISPCSAFPSIKFYGFCLIVLWVCVLGETNEEQGT